MATRYLDEKKRDAGIKLLRELDKNQFLDIVSAMWYYYADTEHWELLIYTPEFYKTITDLKEFYKIIDDCLIENSDISEHIKVSDVRLISNSNKNMIDLFKSIREKLQTDDVMCIRIEPSIFKYGSYLDDILLYRNAL